MKKKIVAVGTMLVATAVILSTNLFAITPDGIGYEGSNVTSNNVTPAETTGKAVYELKLTGDAKQDLVVGPTDEVTLDLAGHKMENYTANNATIVIKEGGKLTIKDTAENGEIKQKGSETGVETIVNKGTLVIEGGKYTTDKKTANLAVIRNEGILTMTAGTISGENECLQNIGTATISGGTIEEKGNFYAVRNEGKMTISGTSTVIKSESNNTSIIGNIGKNNPELTVSGAKVEGATSGVVNYNGEANLTGVDKVHLNGGKVTVDEKSTVTYGSGLVVKVGDTYYADNEETTDIKGETSATDIVEKLKKDGKAKVTVVQGELALTGAATGFTVEKLGEGKVTVNGVEVINKYTVPAQENNEEEEEQDDTPNTGIDVYAVAGAILLVSALGVVVLNKRK